MVGRNQGQDVVSLKQNLSKRTCKEKGKDVDHNETEAVKAVSCRAAMLSTSDFIMARPWEPIYEMAFSNFHHIRLLFPVACDYRNFFRLSDYCFFLIIAKVILFAIILIIAITVIIAIIFISKH
jgi:hypothetical protein